jgi:predicted acylesterase/phospholipase RssA
MARTKFSVLAVDGGGIRGAIPARVLQGIESKLGRPVCELFDVVSGTSTGGIIALGLTKPEGTSRKPAYAASDLLDLYTQDGSKIFPHSLGRRVLTGDGLIDDRYPVGPLEALLQQKFGETKLSEALTELVIPSYDLSGPAPFFFKRTYARDQTHTWDVDMWRVARATSAAPTYFEPAELPQFEHEDDHALVDGGVFANNPAVSAYAEALSLYPAGVEVLVVSVGTGQAPATEPGETGGPISYEEAQHWGLVKWARPLLHVVLDGVAKTVDYELTQILGQQGDGQPRYFRLESPLPTASAAMDDVSSKNIERLVADAETLLGTESDKVEQICTALTAVAADRDANAPALTAAP